MTAFDRFEQRLPDLLDDLAVARMPDYADVLLARTAATRQRPGWTFPERWIPMSALTRRLAAAPQVPLRLAVVVALLAVAALIGALVAGSLTPHRPAPFGPAANGQIAYIDGTGRILAGDPITGQSTVVIGGSNSRVAYSRDGSRIAFLRASAGQFDLAVADADGSHVKTVSAAPIEAPTFMAWTPRGDQIATTNSRGQLLLFDASKAAEPTDLSQKLGVVQVGSGNNDQTAHVFRPPVGDELLFVSDGARPLLRTAHLDGTNLQTLLDPTSLGLGYATLKGAQWSPDGSQILVMVATNGDSPYHLYLMDADGGHVHPLSSLSTVALADEAHAQWSPNGTQIAFQHWSRNPDADQGFFGIAVVDVATGTLRNLGPTLINGAAWAWSPDGLSILELPAAPPGDGHMLIINVGSSVVQTAPWANVSEINWQRTLP
jgi:hypothetical protein